MKTQALTPLMFALLPAFSQPAAAQLLPSTRIITQAELDAEKQKAAQTAAEADKLRQQLREARSAPKPETKIVEKVVTKEIPVTDPKTQKELRDAQAEIAALKKQIAAQSTAKAALQPAPALAAPAPGPVIVPAPQPAPTNAPGQPGTTLKACTDCPEVIWLPQGNYLRGSPTSEKERWGDEGPVRKVTIAYTLAAGKYPVTFNEWDACVNDGGCPKPKDLGWGRGKRPVINVSYNDITQKYLPWLNQKARAAGKLPSGYQFMLPTESEREYFARGITNANDPHPPFPSLPGTRWADGRCPHTDAFNYNGNYDYANCGAKTGVYRGKTVAVDELPYPNRFGLFGVAGNVWEWTRDCMYGDYNQTPDDGGPAKETAGCRRVVSGGSWSHQPRTLRAASRFTISSVSAYDLDLGFRVVLSPRI